jgi:hypothetical protein
MVLRFPLVTGYIGFLPPNTPTDLRAASGIGVGVLLGIVAWTVIIAVGVAAGNWF